MIIFLVEWSKSPSFNTIIGSIEIIDLRMSTILVENLTHGETYSFRIAAASMFGYGEYAISVPKTLKISSILVTYMLNKKFFF